MPKAPPPPWTQRDCRFDHVVVAAAAGNGDPVTYAGIETPDRADDIRRGAYRCALHRELSCRVEWDSGGARTSRTAQWPPDRAPDGTYTLYISVFSKTEGRKRHLKRYGTDRANWPYDTRRPKSQEDIDAWAAKGMDEKGHRRR